MLCASKLLSKNLYVPTDPENDAPQIVQFNGQTEIAEDISFTISLSDFDILNPDRAIIDIELTLTEGENYSVNGNTITPQANYFGSITIGASVTDGELNDEMSISINITSVNDLPFLVTSIPDQESTQGEPFSFMVDPATFSDVEDGDLTNLTATLSDDSALPGWLTFTGGIFSGTPENNDAGIITIKVTATDTNGATISDEFDLIVNMITSINHLSQLGIRVFPNPIRGEVTIQNNSESKIDLLIISDLQGRKVLEQEVTDQTFKIKGLPKGYLIMELIGERGSLGITRLVVK